MRKACGWLLCGAVCLAGLGCGRSELRIGGAPAGSGDGGGRDAGGGERPDADPPDATLPPPCELVSAGVPVAQFSFAGGSADASDLVVLDPGEPTAPRAAQIAVKARAADANMWHPEIHLASVSVGASWPDDLVVDRPLTLFAFESHEWASLAPTVLPNDQLALFWRYDGALIDPISLRLQTFNTESWSPSPPVDVAIGDELGASQGLAAGPGLAASGIGYGGDGYVAAYRFGYSAAGTEPHVALLSSAGVIELGPFPVAPASDYPGRGVSVVWTGTDYLLATSFADCPAGDGPYCSPHSVALMRIRPPELAGDPGGLEVASSFAVSAGDLELTRPRIAAFAGTTWLAWSERHVDDTQQGRPIRVVRAGPDGEMLEAPWAITTEARPETGLALRVNQHGVFVMWGEEGDTSLPQGTPGYARLVIHHLDFEGAAIQSPIEIDVSAIAYYPGLAAVGLDHPKGVLLAWSAWGPAPTPLNEIHLGRLDCAP